MNEADNDNIERYERITFSGERAEFSVENATYDTCRFLDGEAQLRNSRNITLSDCAFGWKIPLWNCLNIELKHCEVYEMAHSALWYSYNITASECTFFAPKVLRRCSNIKLDKIEFKKAQEILWACSSVEINDVTANGDYFAMNSKAMVITNLSLEGDSAFDGCNGLRIYNSRIVSNNAFWNCSNVEVRDSFISGDCLGWYSSDVKFINCIIQSRRGLCYIKNLEIKNSILENTTYAFESSTNIDVEASSKIESIKNPLSGKISTKQIEALILNPKRVDVEKVQIKCNSVIQLYTEDPNPNEN